MIHRQSIAEINLSHLKHNYSVLYKMANSPKFFCPMIKADAYGHGAIKIAETLSAFRPSHLGVGLVEEALELRENGIDSRILMFGIFDQQSSDEIIRNNVTPVISDFSDLTFLKEKLSATQKFRIHLKFNTGMNRLGLDPAEAPRILKFLEANKNFELEGICTHLLNAEDAGAPGQTSSQQLLKFLPIEAQFKYSHPIAHALNSSALANVFLRTKNGKPNEPSEISTLGVRPGISLYGGQVMTQETGTLDLSPVMSLKSKLAAVNKVKRGEVISYSGKWTAKRDSIIGAVPLGYADGYFRGLSNSGEVLCHGFRVPVVGTVCMDYFMVDLTAVALKQKLQIGDEVVVFGKQKDNQILASDLAEKVGTISYEVLARISGRVPRVYVTD